MVASSPDCRIRAGSPTPQVGDTRVERIVTPQGEVIGIRSEVLDPVLEGKPNPTAACRADRFAEMTRLHPPRIRGRFVASGVCERCVNIILGEADMNP